MKLRRDETTGEWKNEAGEYVWPVDETQAAFACIEEAFGPVEIIEEIDRGGRADRPKVKVQRLETVTNVAAARTRSQVSEGPLS